MKRTKVRWMEALYYRTLGGAAMIEETASTVERISMAVVLKTYQQKI
jgi:hypothetical protein